MSEPVRLYSLQDVARLLGVSPSALSNSRKRGGAGIMRRLPTPTYCYGNRRAGGTAPLWTREQMEQYISDREANALAILDGDA